MISYTAYKVLHILGVSLLFCGLGGLCALSLNADRQPTVAGRKALAIAHGVGLVVVLVAGFGLLARLGMGGGLPLWIWLKLILWLLLGGIIVVIKRVPKAATWLLFLLPLLGAVGAYLAFYKIGSGGLPPS